MRQARQILPLLMLLAPLAANGIPITVSGTGTADGDWEVELREGTFSSLESELTSQVWFGDAVLARAFADALGLVPGVDNLSLGLGPAFLYNFIRDGSNSRIDYAAWSDGSVFSPGAVLLTSNNPRNPLAILDTVSLVYATASPIAVPEPGGLTLLGAGLLAVFLARRRCVTST